jgi:pimeloyl-ACP methyl ester carboxylesterase
VWVRKLYDTWSGAAWQQTPGYVAAVERYAEAMRIHPVAYCASEYFRWLVRSLIRRDGRRYAASLRAPIEVPVLQLHGADDRCVLLRTAHGSDAWVRGSYEWHELPGVGHFPHDEVPETVSSELVRWARVR